VMSATFAPARRAHALKIALTASLFALGSMAGIGIGIVTTATPAGAVSFGQGYWLEAADGGVFTHGGADFYGSEGAIRLNSPVVGGAAFPFYEGYWLVASDGGVFSHGSSPFFGSEGARKLNAPVVGMAATPTGGGYWLVASDGGVFSHGDAKFFGSEGAVHLNSPVVGIASTPTGKGYWLVAADGGIFTFGDAGFFGSEGARTLNKPVVGMAATPDGKGYWLAASDGGVFTHGNAKFFGSEGALKLNQPVVGMAATNSGNGYRLVARDGGIFDHGDAGFFGSEGARTLNKPVVGMMTKPAFAVKVDPYPPSSTGDNSTWGGGDTLSLSNSATPESTNVPAGARVLGVEGLSGAQLGTIGFDTDICSNGYPRFVVVFDRNKNGIGTDDTPANFDCTAAGTNTFTAASGDAGFIVMSMDIVNDDPGTTVNVDNIQVGGVTVGNFDTVRKPE